MNFQNARLLITDPSTTDAINLLKSSRYYPSHRALVMLASQAEDDPQNDGLLALSCAVYGWMPTILKNWDFKNFNVNQPIFSARSLSTVEDARMFLSQIDPVSPINKSWIGLSKLLHFLNPELFPIWDSRIAKHFGLNWPSQFNRQDIYISYFDFVHETLAQEPRNVAVVAQHIEKDHSYRPTNVRCLELLLFEAKA